MHPIERFVAACRCQPVDRPPVWLMRQAGRYMPSYQAVRRRYSFMDLCRTPEAACEVTMQPIDELGVDAAILFSDILVPLEPMGVRVGFEHGPVVEPAVRSVAAIDALRSEGVADEVPYVYEAVRLIRRELGGRLPLLGFAGSPWTLASYLVEGGSSRNLHELKHLLYAEPAALERLLDKLTDVVIAYLGRQIDAGVDAVQVFDSWGGVLDEVTWRATSGRTLARIVEALAPTGVPVLLYVHGGPHLLGALSEMGATGLSVDWRVPLSEVRRIVGPGTALQGNVDPGILRAPVPVIREAVAQCLASHGPGPGHIMNLGHGITPDATVAAARAFVEAAQEFGPAYGGEPA
ncbi:MAG: uroporphyrinogen decarboxylase [Deltaproteobacteria bacterium]|nr:uroporphyrinogen decarboxylase [Deltaproteobacteria bacterium]MCB9789256.1 uroporphyrinogen decarboxylase [Deltaproteobacteria bacterium]